MPWFRKRFSKLNLGLQKVLNIFKLNVETVHPFKSLVEYVDTGSSISINSIQKK